MIKLKQQQTSSGDRSNNQNNIENDINDNQQQQQPPAGNSNDKQNDKTIISNDQENNNDNDSDIEIKLPRLLTQVFVDALKWSSGDIFAAKLSDSRLTGLVEQYFVCSDNDEISLESGDVDIMFEPKGMFTSYWNTELPFQIDIAEPSSYSDFYHIQYYEKTHFPLETNVFEVMNDKRYILSKLVSDLILVEFTKYNKNGPLVAEQHGPTVSPTFTNELSGYDFVFAWQMPQMPYSIRQEWLECPEQWPLPDVVLFISRSPCHLVPKRQNTLTW
ncbi:unnamed protein product, partial [Didymodactylos carnosus]